MRLRWVLTGMQVFGDGLELEPIAAPAARLRDELVLPLLRGAEKLARFVPRDTTPVQFYAFVRNDENEELPLPNFFSQPRLGELLLRGRRPLGAAAAAAPPVAAPAAEASGSGVATAAPAAAPAAAPTAEPVVGPAPAAAPVETAEAKRKRKEAEVAEKSEGGEEGGGKRTGAPPPSRNVERIVITIVLEE